MHTISKISILLLAIGLFTFSCKNKERGTVSKHDSMPKELIFKNKFHEANSEKMIGHFDKSILLFNECLVLDPNSAACYFGLSEIYLQQSQNEKGLQLAQKAYDLNPKNKWYLIHLADIYHAVGNYHLSSKYYGLLYSDFEEKNIDYRYNYVESLVYSNQNVKAIEQLNIIEVVMGKSPELSLTKHDLYKAINQEQKANNEISTLLLEYPNNEDIRTQILDYYLQTNQVQQAKDMANKILAINPNNGNAYLGLADIEIRSNHINESFDYLEKGFKDPQVNSERKLALLNGLTSYAFDKKDPNADLMNKRLAPLYESFAENEGNNAGFLLLYGTYLSLNNKPLKAREKFAQSCFYNPADYRAWDALLNADYSANLFDSLYVDGQKAIELFPTQPMAYLLTGIGAYESKHFTEAEEFLFLGKDFVIKDDELSSEFEYHLGKSAWKSGDKIAGKNYFDKAILTYPKNAKVYNGYATFLKNDNKLTEASVQIQKAIAIQPKNELYLDLYGQILIGQKKYPQAEIVFKDAVVINYTNPNILEHYGDALFLNGKVDNALEMWKESKKYGNTSELLNKKIRDKKYYEA